ncbi:MAG: hypothetical protein KKA19_02130, partial [Candidatus Margulisbacteria bacterium]|nr:hypothetical protein [Candidatus Margulisiibacteriota bacterium]
YPVVEKSMQQSYYFTTTKTAFAWSKMALDKLGYVIDEEDAANLTLTTQKDGLKIVVTATDIGDNASAVNVQINAEGGESRDMLESTVDSSLTEIRDELALYQYSKSDTKMFESTPLDKAFRMAKNALVARGYTVTISDAGKYVVAGSKSAKPVKAACLINSMGNNGVAIEITAYVNGKKLSESAATELAASEVAALIKYLGRYDKLDTK